MRQRTHLTPNGQVWQSNCMSFRIQAAPRTFQELTVGVISKQRRIQRLVANLLELKNGQTTYFVGALFDDDGVGASTIPDHPFLLEELFKLVKKH